MKITETEPKKNKVLGASKTVLNIIVVLLAYSLGRIYPLPVCILAVIYFSVVLGMAVSKYNAAKARGEDASGLKKEMQSNIAWTILIALLLGFQIWSVGGFQPKNTEPTPQTPAEIASYGAREAKASTTLPYEVDEVTTLTDITSEGKAIKYIYTIHDADTSNVSNSTLEAIVKPSVCANTDTKNLLNQGVDMMYLYTIKETGARYSFTISEDGC
jgi:hypothetical protein